VSERTKFSGFQEPLLADGEETASVDPTTITIVPAKAELTPDINAAQILQRRFWGRCSEAYRLACKGVSIDGIDGYTMENTPGARLLGALQQMAKGAGSFFLKDESGNQRYVMVQSGSKKTRIRAEDDAPSSDDEFEDALSELGHESGGGWETFFRDPSGIFFNNQHWIPSRQYWSTVKSRVWAAMIK